MFLLTRNSAGKRLPLLCAMTKARSMERMALDCRAGKGPGNPGESMLENNGVLSSNQDATSIVQLAPVGKPSSTR